MSLDTLMKDHKLVERTSRASVDKYVAEAARQVGGMMGGALLVKWLREHTDCTVG